MSKRRVVMLSVLVAAGAFSSANAAGFEPLKMYPWEEALQLAAKEKLPVFAHFSASWCTPCEALKREVYPHPNVAKRLANFVMTEVQTESEPGAGLWLKLKEDGLPVIAFFDATGRENIKLRIRGSKSADELAELLDEALDQFQQAAGTPSRERAAARGRAADGRTNRPKVRGGDWQTTDTSWLGTAVWIMVGVLGGLVMLFVVLKRRQRRSRSGQA